MSNVAPIVVVTILNILLGMLWYSPMFLGDMWAKAHKFEKKKMKPTPMHFIGSVITTLVTACVIAFLVQRFGIDRWEYGMSFGFYFWLGFVATSHFSGVIWAKKPLTVYFIDAGHYLVSLVMMTAIIAGWQ